MYQCILSFLKMSTDPALSLQHSSSSTTLPDDDQLPTSHVKTPQQIENSFSMQIPPNVSSNDVQTETTPISVSDQSVFPYQDGCSINTPVDVVSKANLADYCAVIANNTVDSAIESLHSGNIVNFTLISKYH